MKSPLMTDLECGDVSPLSERVTRRANQNAAPPRTSYHTSLIRNTGLIVSPRLASAMARLMSPKR